MAKEKRYYWLKFKRDFFDNLRIRKLQNIPGGGDKYLLTFIKILTYSIPTGGVIVYQGVFATIEEEIAMEIREDPQTVRIVLEFISSHQMLIGMEEQGQYYLPYAAENIGSEGASAARMRKLRDKDQNLIASQCDTAVTSCDKKVTLENRDREKRIETDTEIENDVYLEKWLIEYSSTASNPQSYKAAMRKKIKTNDPEAIETFEDWKQKKIEKALLDEEKKKIDTFDYSLLIGLTISEKTIIRVVDAGSSIHLFFDDGTDDYNYKKKDLYEWYQSKKQEETA
ncbi:MAG: phage replisome organizer N-terminal domain-containing protein [Campylobacterales bacterium]|nr:phage replisome organizer N-terminal domain-containing protein [Campylobacterales bacterium]